MHFYRRRLPYQISSSDGVGVLAGVVPHPSVLFALFPILLSSIFTFLFFCLLFPSMEAPVSFLPEQSHRSPSSGLRLCVFHPAITSLPTVFHHLLLMSLPSARNLVPPGVLFFTVRTSLARENLWRNRKGDHCLLGFLIFMCGFLLLLDIDLYLPHFTGVDLLLQTLVCILDGRFGLCSLKVGVYYKFSDLMTSLLSMSDKSLIWIQDLPAMPIWTYCILVPKLLRIKTRHISFLFQGESYWHNFLSMGEITFTIILRYGENFFHLHHRAPLRRNLPSCSR